VGQTQGFVKDGFEPVRDLLEEQLADGRDLGASVAVHHFDEVVVDIWGGFADTDRRRPWNADTIVNVWSTTKTMTFIVSLLLLDRGELDFDQPVAAYWPEFAAAGKSDVLFRHLLSHSAGLSGWTESLKPEDLADWDKCVNALAAQEPWWTPGTASGYHAVTQGFLIGEVVRRITGDTIGEFFRREVAQPLDADFHIGLPASEEPRVSLVVPPPPADFTGLDPDSIAVRTLTSPPINASIPHERWWRASEIPAANGHGNARSVARIQSAITNGGESAGRRLLRRETVDRVFDELMSGDDLVLGMPMRFGAGYGLGSETMPLGPRACFWGGFGGSVIIMDQDTGLTISYMMNRMDGAGLVGDVRGVMLAMTALAALSS
jgi:CubicO group peptidase (beta-lactamase class C family)